MDIQSMGPVKPPARIMVASNEPIQPLRNSDVSKPASGLASTPTPGSAADANETMIKIRKKTLTKRMTASSMVW